jgi:LacI family transcriptional regulator
MSNAGPAANRLANVIRERIADGSYPVQSFIPPVTHLAQELSASCTTVSEALCILAERGLVERSRGRGTRVLPLRGTGDSARVGICVPDASLEIRLHTGISLLLAGIRDTLAKHGQACEVGPTDGVNCAAVEAFEERFRAVILLSSHAQAAEVARLKERGVFVVVALLEEDIAVCSTWTDHAKSTAEAVRILAAMGHGRIACITRNAPNFYRNVLDGYRQGLKANELEEDPSLTAVVPCLAPHESRALDSYFATKKLLALPHPPTGIVCARDHMAEGVCAAIHEAHLEIGRDISVIGFDDVSWPQEKPFLTTFKEPRYEIGCGAAEMLCDHLLRNDHSIEKREYVAPLVLRRSAGPAPAAASIAHFSAGDGKSK